MEEIIDGVRVVYLDTWFILAHYDPLRDQVEISSHLKQYCPELHKFALEHEIKHAKLHQKHNFTWRDFPLDIKDRFKLYNNKLLYNQYKDFKSNIKPKTPTQYLWTICNSLVGSFTSFFPLLTIRHYITKTRLILLLLILAGFFYRAYPHIFLISRWITEEQHQYIVVQTLVEKGISLQTLTQTPNLFLSHILVYFLWIFTHINPVVISQYFNTLVAVLTILPIYLLNKILLDEKKGLMIAILWTFSEAVFYRTSTFVSTETVGFFFTTVAIYFFLKKKNIPFVVCIGVCLFSHYLVFLFTTATILLVQFLYKSWQYKLISVGLVVVIFSVLSSPLNPHQDISSVQVLVSKISLTNLNLYSLLDFTLAVQIFFGTVLLGVCTIVIISKARHNKLITSWLVVGIGLVIFSLITYAAYLPSVPRLVFYFVVPLSFYTVQLLSKIGKFKSLFLLVIICISMVVSASISLQPMLFINDSLTVNEYKTIAEMRNMGLFNDSRLWWSDYSARIEISAFCAPPVRINEPIWTGEQERAFSIQICNYEYTFTHLNEFEHKFKYVFLSERMEKDALFIIVGETGSRSEIVRKPVVDIWYNNIQWELLYENYGCRAYHRLEI